MASPSGLGGRVGCVAQASLCCLGGLRLARACALLLRRSLFLGTLSARDWVPVPRPTGLLTARVLGNSGSAPPQVSVWGVCCLFSSYLSSSVVPWDCASSFAPARLSRAPRSGCDSPPRPLPGVSPYQTQGVSISLTHLLLVIHNLTLTRNHSFLAPSGHTFSG